MNKTLPTIFLLSCIFNASAVQAKFRIADIPCATYEGKFDSTKHLRLDKVKALAQQGDLSHMQEYGLLRRHYALEGILSDKTADRIFPETMREDVVEGMTYFYIAATPPGSFSDKVKWHFLYPDNSANNYGKHDFVTPQAWLEEARANAQAWKKHCGL